VICVLRQVLAGAPRAYRNGNNHLPRATLDGANRRAHARTGCQSIIHKDRCPSRDLQRGSSLAIQVFAPIHFLSLALDHVFQLLLCHMETSQHIIIQDNGAAARDCTHRQFFRSRRAELSHHEDVECQAASLRNLERHRNAAPHKAENHPVCKVRQLRYQFAEHASSFPPIVKHSFAHAQDCMPVRAPLCTLQSRLQLAHSSPEVIMRPSFSLGIEEEYQTIDPVTRDLRSHIQTEMLAQGKMRLQERVKAEMHTSVVEVGTRICKNIDEAREDIYELRREMIKLAREHNLELVAGATHPFADWRTQEIYPDPRYHQVVKDLQLVARANLIFGLHVHVGIEDREEAVRVMNAMRYFLPHIMALATNSPFWLGLNTGYKGYRAKVFENFPRTGIPDAFASYSEFENYVSLLVRTNCIDNAKKIWWDIRPHPFFNTVEVRACDIPLRAEETIAIAALIQATAAYLCRLHEANQDFRHYARPLLMENKFRAVRYGLDGKLIDFGKQQEVPERDLIEEYLAMIDPVVDELGSREAIEGIREIMRTGTGADRQLKIFEETNGDLKAVVDYMAEETRAGL